LHHDRGVIELAPDACYRALQTRDPRFDGRLFVGVHTTGVYCRPICPARTPKAGNCRFFTTAAAAQDAGFRPCLRCRPERSPQVAGWRGTSSTVARAVALIADGGLDGDATNVEALSERLGIGERQLRRLFKQHIGASPVAVAQTRRVLFAKQLLQETRLPMVQVAFASGFRSVRRFNDTFQKLYGRPPRELRAREPAEGSKAEAAATGVTLELSYRPPYDWDAMLSFLEARAIAGVEQVLDGVYRRTIRSDDHLGTVSVAHLPGRRCLVASIRFPSVRALPVIVARIRRVFDLEADIETIGAHLSRDPGMAALVARRPGLRAPGGWDGFELATRAILGQQVTVKAARSLAGRLTAAFGDPLLAEDARAPGLTHAFPRCERIAALGEVELGAIGLTRARAASLRALATAAAANPALFQPGKSLAEAIERLQALPGVGEWTAHYIALRALREPDAFPAADIGLLRGASALDAPGGARMTPAALLERAETFRPWRAYAAQHLWALDADNAVHARPGRSPVSG
jgi:AraC family transcriptional regulator of adaptative response / DNA-3-methyladenine glycosylase II